jgi:hypothetical protein
VVDLRAGNGEDDHGYPFDVENQIESLICTDPDEPGSTETWSDYEYETPSAVSYATEAEALKVRDNYVARERAEYSAGMGSRSHEQTSTDSQGLDWSRPSVDDVGGWRRRHTVPR